MSKQSPPVVWLTGLSGAGKSTLAQALADRVQAGGTRVTVLDGDDLREGINSDLGFSDQDRAENVRRTAHVARILRSGGAMVICSLISPRVAMREMAREIIGDGFVEVYVNCPIEVCRERDAKGLYARVSVGEINDFTGIGSDYEPPVSPEVEVRTHEMTVDECVQVILERAVNRKQ